MARGPDDRPTRLSHGRRVLLPAPDKIRAAAGNGKVKPRGQIRQPILSWAGWAVAAVVLLGVAMGASQYRLTEKRSREVETKATAIEKEIEELQLTGSVVAL